jgi:hypothetical protein
MAEVKGLPGFTSYGTPDTPPAAPQTVFPKSQGGNPPPPAKTEVQGLPGFTSYGGTPAKTAAEPATGNSIFWDMFHPQDADLDRPQTWRDWLTKTYSPSAKQVGTAALDDASLGGADYLQSKITGENVDNIRARTADAQAALGPMAPVVNALTYAIPGGGEAKLALTPGKYIGKAVQLTSPYVGRYGAAATEGAIANAASSLGHQAGDDIDYMKLGKDTAWGAAGGVGGQTVGDALADVTRRVGNYVTGAPGRSGEQQWDWRTRAASGPAGTDSVRANIAAEQALRPPDDPAQPALAKTQEALGQSTEPGYGAHLAQGVTGATAAALGAPHDPGAITAALTGGLGVGALTSKVVGNPIAQGINTVDRNINVGQSLDQLYPALYPNEPRSVDTSGAGDAIRQWQIGAQRPTNAAQPSWTDLLFGGS